MEKKFSLEYQYKLYLQRVGITEEQMHTIQRKETKQAFFGACGQMLILLRDDLGVIEDEDIAVRIMEGMIKEVGDYFISITKNQN